MKNILSTLIKRTGLTVTVLTQGYDTQKRLYYSCCVCCGSLCYIEIADNGKHMRICADDKNTINNIKQILESKKNNVVSYSTSNTEYYMYSYMVECVTQ